MYMMSFWSLRPKVFGGEGMWNFEELKCPKIWSRCKLPEGEGALGMRRRRSTGNEKEHWELSWREEDTSGLYETHQSNSGFQNAEIINCFFLFIEQQQQVKGDGRRIQCIPNQHLIFFCHLP
jgi:hypothetical protein